MAQRTLTLADGQLDDTAAVILSGQTLSAPGGKVSAVFANVGSQEQAVVIRLRRRGGTPRRLARAVLEPEETLLLSGLPMQPDDELLALATSEGSVDFLVFGQSAGPFAILTLNAAGAVKSGASDELALVRHLLGGE